MCYAKCDGGRRCPSDLSKRMSKMEQALIQMAEEGARLEDARNDATSASKQQAMTEALDALLVRVKEKQQEFEDVRYAYEMTSTGMKELEAYVQDPETPEQERSMAQFRLAKVREDSTTESRFVGENRQKIMNTNRAMYQAGFAQADIDDINQRYLSRAMNRLPYSTKEAEENKREVVKERRALLASIKALKAEVDEADYLSDVEKTVAKQDIDDEHAAQRAVLEEKLRLAKRKYDVTPAGLEELKKGHAGMMADRERIERRLATTNDAEDVDRLYDNQAHLISTACELKARINLAEREIRLRNDERNARMSLKRAISKAAKKAGSDPDAVWNASKAITPVNLDGSPVPLRMSTDTLKKCPTVHITASDYAAISSDASSRPEYAGVSHEQAVKDLMRKRILRNPVLAHGSQSVAEANAQADLVRDGSVGRYRTKHSEARNVQAYPPLTVKEYEKVKSIAKTLEMTPASYMRVMALGGRETPFAIQNDRSQRRNWAKKIEASTNYLAHAG